MELDQFIRRAIDKSSKTRYQLSKETGVSQSVLSRFMAKQTKLSLENLGALMQVLGLELRKKQ